MKRFILLCAGVLLLVATTPRSAQAITGVPKAFSYQGRLYDTSGNLLGGAGTTYCFRFSIWDSAAAGAGTKLWPAATPGNTPLPVKYGVFNVNIGIDTPDALTFDFNQTDTAYLQLEVAPFTVVCGAFETLNPRQRLTSTGYSINSGALNGATAGTGPNNVLKLDASGNINLSGSAPQLNSTGTTPLTLQGGATGNVQFFNAANSLTSAGTLTLAGNALLGGYLQASAIQPAAGTSLTGTVSKTAGTGNEVASALNTTINKAAGNYTGLQLNVTETSAPGTNRLLDLQVGGASKFAVSSAGTIINGTIPVGSVTGNIVNSITVNGGTARTGAVNLAAGMGITIVDGGTGTLTVSSTAGGGVAGSNGQIQFNNNGLTGASANLLFDATNNRIGINTTLATTLDALTVKGGDISLDSQNSSSVTRQLLFRGTSGSGNLRIAGDGGDIIWQGGAGQKLQMDAYHGIVLAGARQSGAIPAFETGGTGALAGTEIRNTTGTYAALQVTGVTGQTANLSQWLNSAGTTVASIDPAGNLLTGNTITVGSGGATIQSAAGQPLALTSSTTLTLSGGINSTAGGMGVVIGSGVPDANQVNLQLDTSTTYAETASTCGTNTNQGALYYNSSSGSIRACTSSSWSDLVATNDLGLNVFGVVPLSGSNPGDLAGAVSPTSGPCKVSWATAATINLSACNAYSGGRKVQVGAAGSVVVPMNASTPWVHYCLSGANNQPVMTAGAAEATNLATTSLASTVNPTVCLADIKTNGTSIVGIYDTRPFTSSEKQLVSITVGIPALGQIVTATITGSTYALSQTTAGAGKIVGIVVATNGMAGTQNAVIATTGPNWVKATAGSAGNQIENGTTVGYATTIASVPAAAYSLLGTAVTSFTAITPCTSVITCSGSLLTTIAIR